MIVTLEPATNHYVCASLTTSYSLMGKHAKVLGQSSFIAKPFKHLSSLEFANFVKTQLKMVRKMLLA